MLTLLFLSIITFAVYRARRAWKRATPAQQRSVAAVARKARLRSGHYTLADLLASIVDEVLGQSLPSHSRTYVKNEIACALSVADFGRVAEIRGHVERELVAELVRVVAASGRLHLAGPVSVSLVVDAAVVSGTLRVTGTISERAAAPVPAPVEAASLRRRLSRREMEQISLLPTRRIDRADAITTKWAG